MKNNLVEDVDYKHVQLVLRQLAAPVVRVKQERNSVSWKQRSVTATDIAIRLSMLGIKGRRREPCHCPVAIYVRKALGLSESTRGISIWPSTIYLTHRPAPHFARCRYTPQEVGDFILRFDRGEYPYLET